MSATATTAPAPAPAAAPSHTRGPSALGGDLRRSLSLTWILAVTDFKLRYFGSVLGYLWTLMRPLMLFAVLYFVFTQVFALGEDVRYYAVYLLTSIVLYGYFQETTGGGVQCLMARENLLRKMHFPRIAIPVSVSLSALFNLGLNLIAVAVFAVAAGVTPHWSWLEFPLLVLALAILSIGFAMLLSVLYVRFRDIEPIWDVVLRIAFYASPVLYVIGMLPQTIQREMLAINPLATILTQMRHAVLDPSAPSAATAIGGTWRLLIPATLTVGVFVLGLWLFKREAPRIAENL
ncbi:MAG: ABC transporter permease [Solirubrobacterales bacterium]|nr:ABC transporter permease [Solirubrobacterales bacterium]